MSAPLRLVGGRRSDIDPDLVAFGQWQANLRGLRPNTVRVRGDVLQRVSEFLGKPMREATEGDLLRWEQQAVAGRKPETRRAYVSHVKAFYRWAMLAGIIGANPSVRLTNPKLNRALPRPVPEEALRRAVDGARPKMRLMILLGAFCGLRCQEIAGLHWTDLTTSEDGQTVLLVREGKGGKERVVPVPKVVLDAFHGYGRRRSGPVFYGLNAAQQTPNSVSSSINDYFDRLGLNYTAHQLRHRYGTTCYRLSKDIRMTQELLGHGSPTTTAGYAAYDKANEAELIKAMDEAWQGGSDDQPPTEAELEAAADALREEPTAPYRDLASPYRADRRRAQNYAPEPKGSPEIHDAEIVEDDRSVLLQQAIALLEQAGFVVSDGSKERSAPEPRRPTVNDLGLLRHR